MADSQTFAQLTQPTAGLLLTAPSDGVITAWHVHGNTLGSGSLALRVLRRSADGISFTAVATSAAVTADEGDGSPAHPVSLPVRAGDYIGIELILAESFGSSQASVDLTLPQSATYGGWHGFADGSTSSPPSIINGRLMLNAVETLSPALTGVSPSSGSTAGGQAVTITGSNLDGASAVSFGGTPATSFTASATQITATAPAHAQGTVDVRVTGPGGVSPASGADSYSYVRPGVVPPSIAIASPADGATYTRGQPVSAAYACTPSAATSLTSCSGPVADGALIDTTTVGPHPFTVSAQGSDGGEATRTAGYTVAAAVTPIPIVSGASETAKTWRENNMLARISAKRRLPVGTTFSFTLNEPATVTLSFTQHAVGRRVHRACLAPRPTNRHMPGCIRPIAAGRFVFAGHSGTNKIFFLGRISPTKKLKPGSYTLQITATIAARKRSAPRSLTFTIVK